MVPFFFRARSARRRRRRALRARRKKGTITWAHFSSKEAVRRLPGELRPLWGGSFAAAPRASRAAWGQTKSGKYEGAKRGGSFVKPARLHFARTARALTGRYIHATYIRLRVCVRRPVRISSRAHMRVMLA